ncbi:MAG: PD40 domain-containing protein [Flavobacteriales bacterium]|nr:PD40 domain-containing protein [Flavobacteriales bacterium]
MTRFAVIFIGVLLPFLSLGQGGDQQLRAKADALFNEKRYAEAMPMYSQLVSLTPADRDLNYRFGACLLFGGSDKEKAIGHLKYATEAPSTDPRAWYWLGRAYHLNYRFREAQAAYQRFLGTDDKKAIAELPVDALQKQCRNGEKLLNNLKEITVRNKVEVDDKEFFRFYDLSDIGGKIVVLPEELRTSLDKKSKERSLVYLPERGGPIYFSSYGKDGKTGRDIYRTELLPDGTFAAPVKLAGYINTDQDEDFPFLHPDGKTFYFSSKGHNSMGGYDVFRAAYDRGMDAFGRPENLDFAVNTPDDDIFYLVDPEGKEACFASARSSRQGQVHVYRVATAQLPLVITVLKGTFASEYDELDRKARIMVEDALTGEQVADVRTDLNGNYALSLPRSGRFRYKVECGPTGKTHGGIVEVPRSDGPKAYRQELTLTRNGDQERLVIRNYFETPLDDDLLALALDEIKRRARLDVNGDRPVAAQPAPEPSAPADLMTQAGFAGDMDERAAVKLAQEDALELERMSEELSVHAQEAFSIALDATTEAERETREAEARIQAAAQASTEEERNALMVEAARARQRSREAAMRAQAAHRTGVALESEAQTTRQKAATATRLSTELQATMAAGNDARTLAHLTELKQRLDTKARPDLDPDVAEKARRTLSAQEKESARLLTVANGKRTEENEMTDRLNRLKREQTDARSKAKKDELQRSIDELSEQLAAQHSETEAAFAKARAEEKRTATLRGQASLTKHLTTGGSAGVATRLDAAQVEQLGGRIAGSSDRIEALPIDERFDAQLAVSTTEAESRTFDWALVSAANGTGAAQTPTQAQQRTTEGQAQATTGRTAVMPNSGNDQRTLEQGQVGVVPVSTDRDRAEQGPVRTEQQTADASTEAARTGNAAQQGQQGQQGQQESGRTEAPTVAVAVEAGKQGGGDLADGNDTRPEVTEQQGTTDGTNTDRFVVENQRDELRQLIAVERDRGRRDSLQRMLTEMEAKLAAMEKADALAESTDRSADDLSDVQVDPARTPLVFDRNAPASAILPKLYADYDRDRKSLMELPDADERAAGLNGLELMLADSIREEMARQVQLLELAPQRAEEVLPRVARLREMRAEQLQKAEQHLRDRQNELAALGTADGAPKSTGASDGVRVAGTTNSDPVNDRFVQLAPYATDVYASKLEHRATTVDDAVAFRDADLARMEDLTTRIDSLEAYLASATRDRAYDRTRKETDRLIDERLIIRADLGQRSAYLTKEEWRAATDSMKVLDKAITTKGFAPTEPLLLMAQDYRTSAQAGFDKAAQLRKRADRSEDIILRDSLFRTAYRTELEALRDADRSITVRNYLLGDAHQRGETLAYDAIAERMFGRPATEATANTPEVAQRTIVEAPTTTAEVTPPPTEQVGGNAQNIVPTIVATGVGNDGSADPVTTSEQPEVAVQRAPESGAGAAPAAMPATTTTPASASLDQARIDAERMAAAAEQRLSAEQRSPAARYERFLSSEAGSLTSLEAADPSMDPQLLTIKAESARTTAAEQQQDAMRLQDMAVAYADSAATARKRDRDRLEKLAVRARIGGDSLQAASLVNAEKARELELSARQAEAARLSRERLVKYYYLSSEEQLMVEDDTDHSRYFQARSLALEQYTAADDASRAAVGNREVSAVLRAEARTTERDAANGRVPAAVAVERMNVLNARADALDARADSLDNVASRLRGAAAINEAQAGVMLQGLNADRSSSIMALEMRTRRTEPMLASARMPAPSAATGAPGAASTAPVRATAPAPTATPDRAPTPEPVIARTEVPTPSTGTQAGERPAPATAVRSERPVVAADERPSTLRMPDELVTDMFELRAATERREEAIPMDMELPKGIVFKVQIGAFRNAVPQEAFSDMTPVMGETVGNGLVRYTAGLFTGFEQAARAKDQVRDRGYRDAFVVAYRDGQRIPLGEAMRAARAEQAAAPLVSERAPAPANTVLEPAAQQPAPVVIQPPTQPLPPTPAEEAAQVLARYPATAQEIVATFAPAPEATSYYNVPGAAPARQVETVKGLFFTVQVGVYSKPVPLDRLFNITPLNSELTETQKVRYTTGLYLDVESARVRKDEAVVLGVKDAFITAYLNGKRIPMREATALLEKFGPEILAKP